MRVLGLISGTSMDGIDAAAVDFALDAGTLHGRVLHGSTTPYSAGLGDRLRAALPPAATTFEEVCRLDTLVGQEFAAVAADVAGAVGGVDLIVSHGQTMFHWVDGGHALGTLQIGQPAWIAERAGAPVLADVRVRDVVAGGHGAPLVSYLDALLLAGRASTAVALNLGGIANITVLRPDGSLVAYDTGPANALVDAVVAAQRLDPAGYDTGGRLAASGAVDEALLAVLLDDPYYRLPPPRSTGKELFHLAYVRDAIARAGTSPSPADLIRTLTELTARTVAGEVRRQGATLLAVSGGGWHNPVLMDGIRSGLPGVEVVAADEFGAPADEKEAIAFALLGWCSWHGLPGTVPAGTGARAPRILGSLTPGAVPLRLPQPLGTPPARLRLHDERGRTGRAAAAARRAGALTLRLRAAGADDLAAIVEVFLACWRTSYRGLLPDETIEAVSPATAGARWRRALADPAGRVVVAEHDGVLVGVTCWTPAEATVQSLYVHPDHQGLGTGRALLDAALADLTAGGATTARLWVFEANAPARAFYRRHAWVPDGATRTEERFGLPELRLTHPLEAA